ncbi:MAG: hypothetical protein WD404_03440 [Solirubrobacterales bacterium]
MARRRLNPALLVAWAASLLLAGCGGDSETRKAAEPFAPGADLTAIGGTARTEKPEVVLRVEARPGDAAIRSAAVTLPASFLVDQTALGNLCSERELEEDDCAGRKRMGVARVRSPLYGEALAGPVYAVSGSGGLPRLAFVLGGPAELLLRGRIAVQGSRLKAGVEDVPETPMRSFELRIDGGPPGYLVVSRDLCRAEALAHVSFTSHSGEVYAQRLPLTVDC